MAGGVPAGRLSIELVAEIARLQQDLDKAKASVRAASADIAKSAKAANDNLASIGNGARLAGHHTQNLMFQFQDLGIGMAAAAQSGHPLQMVFMTLIQQGSQIAGIMMQAGIGVRGLVAEIAGMIGRFAMAHPILIAVSVAVGALYGAFQLFQGQVEKSGELDRYAKSLGLTSDEMKDLTDVTVTAGDAFTGLWRYIDKGLGASKVFASIKAWATDTFKTAIGWAQNFAAFLYAAVAGSVHLFKTLASAAKQVLSGDFGGALTTIVSGRVLDGYAEAYKDAKAGLQKMGGDIGQEIIGASKDRIAAQARVIIDKRAEDKAVKEAKSMAERMADTIRETMSKLWLMKDFFTAADAGFEGDPLKEQREAIEEAEKSKQRILDEQERYDREARDRALKTAYDIADIIGGGVGGAIKDLADVLDKEFPDFMRDIGEQLKKITDAFGDDLGEAFDAISAGAKVGAATDGIMKGLGIKSSKTGAQLGGAVGSLIGGPIGAIAGSILGGVVGGMLKKVKKASATIEIMAGNAVQTSLTGNSSKLKKVAGAMADSLIGGLTQIADQLGGMLGDGIKVSIGQRKKKFVVDLQGLGRTKGMPSFDSQEEAVAYAIQEVIKQGAIVGLRAGTEALLKGGDDLQAQLQKALSFEQVFKDLETATNPAASAIDDITKQMKQLMAIFDEAGASADDYAKLLQLMAIRQQEAIEQAMQPIRSMLDDLKAKAESAGDAVRTAFDAVLQREADAIATYRNSLQASIDKLQTGMSALQDQANDFAQAASKLRDFAGSISEATVGNLRAQYARLVDRARGGDTAAMDAIPDIGSKLRDAVTASATDRVSLVRELAGIRNGALAAAGAADARGSIAEKQLAAAQTQVDKLQKQIDKLGDVQDAVVSVDQALADMQTAVAAADQARAQMALLSELQVQDLSFADAVAQYEAAKAARDELLQQITAAGFANLIEEQKQTGAQLVAALAAASAKANQASADAAAAMAAAQVAQAATRVANDNAYSRYLSGSIPGFAAGGNHGGGWRVVGEEGFELENTGPSRIYNDRQMSDLLGGDDGVREEVAAMRQELGTMLRSINSSNAEIARLNRRWEGEGLPPEREVA